MEAVAVLAEKDIAFRGIWVVGYRVSENILQSIAKEFPSKPSRSCTLTLTTAGLTLELNSSTEGRRGKTNQIPFKHLQDITRNRYHPNCLIVVYTDPQGRYSIMVCSSQDEKGEKDLEDICQAYRNHKFFLQQHQVHNFHGIPHNPNWTLRQSQLKRRRSSGGSVTRIPPRFASGSFNTYARPQEEITMVTSQQSDNSLIGMRDRVFSDGSDNLDGDVFFNTEGVRLGHETVLVDREPVDANNDGEPEAFNVGIQTISSDKDYDSASIISSSSLQTIKDDIHSLNEDMKAIKFLLEKSTGISAEEYFRGRDMHGNRRAIAFNSSPKTSYTESHTADIRRESNPYNSVTEEDGGFPVEKQNGDANNNNNSNGEHNDGDNEIDDDEDYDLRSIGMQTDKGANGGQRGRYVRKPLGPGMSNAYKEKMASLRKRGTGSGSGGGSTSNGSGSFSDAPDSHFGSVSSAQSYRSRSSSVGSASSRQPVRASTVPKSIEHVYVGRPRSSYGSTGSSAGRPKKVVFLAPKAYSPAY